MYLGKIMNCQGFTNMNIVSCDFGMANIYFMEDSALWSVQSFKQLLDNHI